MSGPTANLRSLNRGFATFTGFSGAAVGEDYIAIAALFAGGIAKISGRGTSKFNRLFQNTSCGKPNVF